LKEEIILKKIINAVDQVENQMIEGMVKAFPQYVKKLDCGNVVVRAEKKTGKVALISGGGSGHEPAHGGFVGKGMLDAAVAGAVFTSPTPDQIYEGIKAVDDGKGVLMVVKNYTGDVLNFEMAAEMAADMDGIEVKEVVVNDDVAVQDSLYTTGRRGVAGTVFVHKIAGALAEKGASLAKTIADYYTANPTVPVTKQNANAAATVINAHADMAIANGTFDKDTIKKVYPSTGSVTNAVAVQTIEKSQISNLSLTKKDDNTLVLSATWTGTQPSAGANIAVYGMDTSAAYQIVFVDDAGNRTTIDSVSKVADGVVVFWVPHFSTYEIVKVSAAADTAPATTAPATTTVDAAAVDAQFYTCKACGYHNWTGTVGGYKCDHCGHIEAKDLSSYPNVKGTATLPTATSAAASNNIIKATGADMSMVVLAVLALAAALVAGFACIVRKQGLGK